MKQSHQPQKRSFMGLVSLGLGHPAAIVALIVFLGIGIFLIGLYQDGTIPEGVAAFLVLIPGAIWYFVAYVTGSAKMDALEAQLKTAQAHNAGRGGERRLHGSRVATAGAVAATGTYFAAPDQHIEDEFPMVNIDGTPMMGDIDMKGNPYGVVGPEGIGDPHDTDPAFNVDGTPMVGIIDTNGNPYGVSSFDDPFR